MYFINDSQTHDTISVLRGVYSEQTVIESAIKIAERLDIYVDVYFNFSFITTV